MRKLIRIFPIVLLLGGSLSLGGCASLAESALSLPSGVLTQSVQNPITRDHLYRIENGLIVGVSALNSYKRLCDDGTLPASCIGVIQKLQAITRQARPVLRQLRRFVRQNDQVNAKVMFTTLQGLVAEFRGTATAAGISVPELQGM